MNVKVKKEKTGLTHHLAGNVGFYIVYLFCRILDINMHYKVKHTSTHAQRWICAIGEVYSSMLICLKPVVVNKRCSFRAHSVNKQLNGINGSNTNFR